MNLALSAPYNSLLLHADGDLERGHPRFASFEYELVDETGATLVDSTGNSLVAQYGFTLSPQTLRALPDDWKLTSE